VKIVFHNIPKKNHNIPKKNSAAILIETGKLLEIGDTSYKDLMDKVECD
jgi:hypothetical protein